MKTINTLLNLPEYASETERACAVYNLKHDAESVLASCATAENKLAALRTQTGRLFADAVCAAHGITDAETYDDIAAAWCEDPYSALNAFCNAEDISASNPYGCNQWGHEWRGKHGESWKPRGRGEDSQISKEKQKGKNLSDALKKIAPHTDKKGKEFKPKANDSSSFEKSKAEYESLLKAAEAKINELQKIKNDAKRSRKEKIEAYDKWSSIYQGITAASNIFKNYDKYDEKERAEADKDMLRIVKWLKEDIK